MKKKKIVFISLILGVCTFATAAFASYSTANGYDVLKKSVISLLGSDNYTMNTKVSILSDDQEFISSEILEEYDGANNLYHSKSSTKMISDDKPYTTESFSEGGDNVYYIDSENNEVQTATGYNYAPKGILSALNPNDDMNKKYIRFAELFCDTMIGDLKNNFTYIKSTDDKSTYEVKLSSIQIPEIVNAGLSILSSGISSDIAENSQLYSADAQAFANLGDNPTVTSATLKFDVDNNGKLSNFSATGVVEGYGHSTTINLEGDFTNFGTTSPQKISQEQKDSAVTQSYTYDDEAGMVEPAE